MNPGQALNKIAELGQQLMLDPNPEVARLGAAVLALPIAAAEDSDDFNELVHVIFMFVRVKAEQQKAIKRLLEP